MRIAKIRIRDYDEMIGLWKKDEGIRLSGADSRQNVHFFLRRNRGLSLKAEYGGKVVATLLCGYDGRRGYFHHLYVAPGYRRMGIARALVEGSVAKLKKLGIEKTHIFVLPTNADGQRFWESLGFYRRDADDVLMYSRDL